MIAESWLDQQSCSALLSWNDETTTADPRDDPSGTIEVVGYTGAAYQPDDALKSGDLMGYSSTLSGCFGLIRARPGTVEAVTDYTRSNPLYWAESETLRLVGTRALLVHLMARWGRWWREPIPDYDLAAVGDLIEGGYFLADRTPFTGVAALDCAQIVRLDPWRTIVSGSQVSAGLSGHADADDWHTMVGGVASALVEAVDPIPGPTLNLALTGGRDSRMLAAALHAHDGYAVATSTMGMEDDPDVIIARQIAHCLGLEHQVRPQPGVRDQGGIFAEPLEERITRVLDVHDAMNSAWDDIEDYGPFMPEPILSGVGGEVVRGGIILPGIATLDSKEAVAALTGVAQGARLLNPDAAKSREALLQPLIELAREDPHRSIDDFYIVHRQGRWVASRRSGARFRRRVYDPLLDNLFMRRSRKIPAQLRWEERLAFELIKELAPKLADLPIEGSPWRFDIEGFDHPPGRESRRVMVRSSSTAAYSWKTLVAPNIRSLIDDLILDGLTGPMGDIVDRERVSGYLADLRVPTPAWHLATVAVLLGRPWHKTRREPKREVISVDVGP